MTCLFSAPVGTGAPLALFPRRDNHPASRHIVVGDVTRPVPTNKFYTNLLLGEFKQNVYALPYVLWMTMENNIWGLSVSHTDANQRVTGPNPDSNPVKYYFSPVGIRSFTITATEFNRQTSSHTVDSPTAHSVNLNLHANRSKYGDSTNKIAFPLVQGMGFVSARYYNLVPVLASGIMFRSIAPMPAPRAGMQKWIVVLEDGKIWIVYAVPALETASLALTRSGNDKLVGSSAFTGTIQISKLSDSRLESILDSAAGAFSTGVSLSGTIFGSTGSYTFTYTKVGQNNALKLLMYALPHHMASFNSATLSGQTNLALHSPTKGLMRGVLADAWSMYETGLVTTINWLPAGGMSQSIANAVTESASRDLQQDMDQQSNLDSMYFSGKAVAKFAQVVLALVHSKTDPNLARQGLKKVQDTLSRFTNNRQKFPLVYDCTWRGLVSDAMYKTGDPNVDFGNSYYNDHHFHYGYFIYTAACIGYCERALNNSSAWVTANKGWVNQLVRDTANPHPADPYFPESRCFDWWNGHSWAKGLFESADGKDQESSSEDYHFAYGMRQWGRVIDDNAMAGRGELMLGIMRRTMDMYFLMDSSNRVHPVNFIKNKVTGILFENKVDHTTYFGNNIEYIHGIHMIPLMPMSPYIRTRKFVREEWDTVLSSLFPTLPNNGWKGILMANYGIIDPVAAYNYFVDRGFDEGVLDPGTSRTWYLALVGGWLREASNTAML